MRICVVLNESESQLCSSLPASGCPTFRRRGYKANTDVLQFQNKASMLLVGREKHTKDKNSRGIRFEGQLLQTLLDIKYDSLHNRVVL